MTGYTNISNALVQVGAKPFSTTVTALRDNPLAIAEGAASAPRIQLGALERLVAGDSIRFRDDAETIVDNTTAALSTPLFIQGGTFRLALEHRRNGGGTATFTVNRTRAGITTNIVTYTDVTGTYVARSIDIDVIPGDRITMTHSNSGGAGNQSRVRNRRISVADGVAFWPIDSLALYEGNPALT